MYILKSQRICCWGWYCWWLLVCCLVIAVLLVWYPFSSWLERVGGCRWGCILGCLLCWWLGTWISVLTNTPFSYWPVCLYKTLAFPFPPAQLPPCLQDAPPHSSPWSPSHQPSHTQHTAISHSHPYPPSSNWRRSTNLQSGRLALPPPLLGSSILFWCLVMGLGILTGRIWAEGKWLFGWPVRMCVAAWMTGCRIVFVRISGRVWIWLCGREADLGGSFRFCFSNYYNTILSAHYIYI